jgi:hypothetical protein
LRFTVQSLEKIRMQRQHYLEVAVKVAGQAANRALSNETDLLSFGRCRSLCNRYTSVSGSDGAQLLPQLSASAFRSSSANFSDILQTAKSPMHDCIERNFSGPGASTVTYGRIRTDTIGLISIEYKLCTLPHEESPSSGTQ